MPQKLDIWGDPMPEREDDEGSMELGDVPDRGDDHREPGDGPKSPSSDSPNFEVATKLDKGKQRAVSESGEEDDAEDAAEETELFGQFYSREDVLEQQRMIEEYSAKQAATRQAAEGRGQWEKALQSRNLATIEEDEEDDLQVAIRQSVQDQQHETDQSSSSTAAHDSSQQSFHPSARDSEEE